MAAAPAMDPSPRSVRVTVIRMLRVVWRVAVVRPVFGMRLRLRIEAARHGRFRPNIRKGAAKR